MSNNSKLPPNKAAFDPGWNDPPMFSYGATPPSAAGKSKLNLNKRVAFPLQSIGTGNPSTTSKTPLASSGLPMPFAGSIVTPQANIGIQLPGTLDQRNILPPPTAPLQLPEAIKQEDAINTTNEIKEDDELQSYVLTILDRTITSLSLTNNTSELKEIIKRIDILKLSYDRLDHKIRTILYNIANSIERKNIPEATNFHRLLVVDYLNVSSQWAPALRQLILLAEPKGITKYEESGNLIFYSNPSTDTTSGLPISPASQQENIQKSTTKHNFSKIYHI